MNYLVENMTRAPSQVLVKSASTFGEEAAKVLGKIIEESLKNCTNDITLCIKESTTIASKKVSKAVSGFGQTFKETGVEGFTEWGIGIERAFYHLGQKIETGLTNASGRFTTGVQETVESGFKSIDGSIRDGTNEVTDKISKQVPIVKQQFQRELNILLISILFISAAVFIWSLSALLSLFSSPTPNYYPPVYAKGDIRKEQPVSIVGVPPIVHIANILIYLAFAGLIGYAIYVWSSKQSDNSTSISQQSDESDQKQSTTKEGKNKRSLSPSTDDVSQILDSPKVFLFVVGVFGFFAGNVGHQLASSFNFVLLLLVTIVVGLVVYKALAFQLVYIIYRKYQRYREFCEWDKRQKSIDRTSSE